VWPLLARLAQRYHCTTDYLLGLTEHPNGYASTPALPAAVAELAELAQELSPSRQAELLEHARVLLQAEHAANLRQYDRTMALVMALLPDGDLLRQSVEEALRAGAAQGPAAALRIVDAFIEGRLAQTEPLAQPDKDQVEER